jgi:mono/diheme cytochrome c family protein
MQEHRRSARRTSKILGFTGLTAGLSAALALAACVGSPTPATAQASTALSGQALYAQHCSACHGLLAEGDGPVADVMRVTVPNLRTLQARANGTFPRDAVMRYIDGRDLPAAHGDRYMPVWGEQFASADSNGEAADDALADLRIAAIVDFLEQIQN